MKKLKNCLKGIGTKIDDFVCDYPEILGILEASVVFILCDKIYEKGVKDGYLLTKEIEKLKND